MVGASMESRTHGSAHHVAALGGLRGVARPRSVEIPGLTPLRGLAALLVVVFHLMEFACPEWWARPGLAFIRHGYLAVDLFFVLSGFVITHVYAREFATAFDARRYRTFLMARLARIYPLHVFILGLWVALEFVRPRPFQDPARSVTAIGTNLLLIQDWHVSSILTWNEAAWSISAEWAVYLAFPVIVLLTQLRVVAARAAAVLSIFALLCALVHFAPWTPNRLGDIDIAADFGVVRCALEFGLGVLAYGLYADGAFLRFFDKDLTIVVVAGCVVAGMHWRIHDLVTVAAFVLLVLCAAQNQGAATRILDTRVLRFLGDISYSVYMVHMFFREVARMALKRLIGRPLWEVTGPAERVAVLSGWVAIILAASALTWRLIEVPMRERLKPARPALRP